MPYDAQFARQCAADVTVIGLIGERGCEVQDLLAAGIPERSVVTSGEFVQQGLHRKQIWEVGK